MGWKFATDARRYVGSTVLAAVAGVKSSSESSFVEADVLPLTEQLARS